ncbi:MAG: ABC transporter ATP-binding protein [[Clostridium] spiroforme]|uniref:ABC transporter ATP-binding protein n=1 Tax=Thomasclavelia spiroformis TaxID=29348 RepID=A0A943I6S3_9FIRM|nr:ABC transporter ATP-binding protein [Thomasclavelia spiroformis]MBS5587486.1 ABC transporter ATP-binding protein [Thomasclavelia spiroformis]
MAIVKLENISKSYYQHNVFHDFSLEIDEGEFIIISGKSGSGKSTLCNIIGLLDKPDQGKVFIKNQEIDYKDSKVAKLLSKNISYLFQNFALIDNKTVGYNLELVYPSKKERKNNRKLIEEKLSEVGMEGTYDKYIYECSGGQQQRVAIARLLLKQGDIIICDEPTGSLDEENKMMVMNLICDMHKRGKTIIMVTHDKTLYSYAKRVVMI